jgi:hypothetical protein
MGMVKVALVAVIVGSVVASAATLTAVLADRPVDQPGVRIPQPAIVAGHHADPSQTGSAPVVAARPEPVAPAPAQQAAHGPAGPAKDANGNHKGRDNGNGSGRH